MKKPYRCQADACCDKAFTTRFSLRRHESTHTPSKQHKCLRCGKTFALGQYLKEHMYIHTGQKPFKCPYEGCTKAFRQAGKLSLHKKLHQNKIFIVQKVKRKSQPLFQESTQAMPEVTPLSQDGKIKISLMKIVQSKKSTESSYSSDDMTDSCSLQSSQHEESQSSIVCESLSESSPSNSLTA